MERSPAIERAQDDVLRRAQARSESSPTLADWFDVLLADEEGRPALLLEKLNINRDEAIGHLGENITHHRPAPDTQILFTRGRDLATILRGDPTLTTDAVFLAVIETAETVSGGLAILGGSIQRLADAFADRAGQDEKRSTNDAPQTEWLSSSIGFVSDSPLPLEEGLRVNDHIGQDLTDHTDFHIHDPFETAKLHRILDSALNRAREAIRVVEDYVRFGLNDRLLTEELKAIRHELGQAVNQLSSSNSIRFRDTPGDIGTTIQTSTEYHRSSPRDTCRVNFKRLQEALRSVEEYGKQMGPIFAKRIEALRYRSYTLERACLGDSSLIERLHQSLLYVLLSAKQCVAAIDWTIREAAAGGVSIFQLREKSIPDRELLDRARFIRKLTHETKTLLIVNDRPDIARLVEADGVHLGQDDLTVAEARRLLSPDQLIGVSTHDITQLQQAVLDGADYLGIGPVFPSTTKTFDHFPGLAFVREAAELTTKPMFALGGITAVNVHQVVAAGVNRVALAAAIVGSDDPRHEAQKLSAHLQVTALSQTNQIH